MVSSSTKLSSERRNVATSSREAARNARGYTLPLCGELNTTGPGQSCGSSVSKGGSNSSFRSDMRSVSNRCLEKRATGKVPLGEMGPGPALKSHHYRWKRAIVHGAKGGCPRPWGGSGGPVHPIFTRHPAYGGRGNKGAWATAQHPQRAGRWRKLSLPKTTTTCGASW